MIPFSVYMEADWWWPAIWKPPMREWWFHVKKRSDDFDIWSRRDVSLRLLGGAVRVGVQWKRGAE